MENRAHGEKRASPAGGVPTLEDFENDDHIQVYHHHQQQHNHHDKLNRAPSRLLSSVPPPTAIARLQSFSSLLPKPCLRSWIIGVRRQILFFIMMCVGLLSMYIFLTNVSVSVTAPPRISFMPPLPPPSSLASAPTSPPSSDSDSSSFSTSIKLRIAMVSTYPPQPCGVGTFTRDLVASLLTLRNYIEVVDVYVIHNGKGRHEEFPLSRYLEQGYSEVVATIPVHDPNALNELVYTLNNKQYDVVILQHEYGMYPTYGEEMANHFSSLSTPLIVHYHSPMQFPKPLEVHITRLLDSVTTQFIVMTKIGIQHLIDGYGISPSKITYIPHGAIVRTPESCSSASRDAARQRAFPTLSANHTLMINFGLVHPHKGIKNFVHALPGILQSSPNAVLAIIGQQNPGDESDAYGEILEYVTKHHIESSIMIINKFMTSEELYDCMLAADMIITPYSEYTPVSGVLTSAVAFGVPVVATYYNYAVETRKILMELDSLEGGNSLNAPPLVHACFHDPRSLARVTSDYISRFRRNWADWNSVCQRASHKNFFSWRRIASEVINLTLRVASTYGLSLPQTAAPTIDVESTSEQDRIKSVLIGDTGYGFYQKKYRVDAGMYNILSDIELQVNVQLVEGNKESGTRYIQAVGVLLARAGYSYHQYIHFSECALSLDHKPVLLSDGQVSVPLLFDDSILVRISKDEYFISHGSYRVRVHCSSIGGKKWVSRIDMSTRASSVPDGYVGQTSRVRKMPIADEVQGKCAAPVTLSKCQGCFQDSEGPKPLWTYAVSALHQPGKESMLASTSYLRKVLTAEEADIQPSVRINDKNLYEREEEKMNTRMRLTWAGPYFDLSGFATVNRENVARLLFHPNLAVTIESSLEYNYGKDVAGAHTEDVIHQRIASHLKKQKADSEAVSTGAKNIKEPDFEIRMEWPPQWEKPHPNHVLILYQPFEFGVIPYEWVKSIESSSEIWVPSEYSRQVYVKSGVPPAKVQVLTHGVTISDWYPAQPPLSLCSHKSFRFLYRGGLLPRKGIDVLLKAYISEFSSKDDVCLIIHSMYGDYYQSETKKMAQSSHEKGTTLPYIEFEFGKSYSKKELNSLHSTANALVIPSRSEGFGLCAIEAMASLLPVILVNESALQEFSSNETAYLVKASESPCMVDPCGEKKVFGRPTPIQPTWFEPDQKHLREVMRHVFESPHERRAKASRAFKFIEQHYTWERSTNAIIQRLKQLWKLKN